MLTIGIGVIGFVVLYVTGSEGNWGAFAVAGAILLLLILMSACERRDTRAWANRQRYWSDGWAFRDTRPTVRVEQRTVVRSEVMVLGRTGRIPDAVRVPVLRAESDRHGRMYRCPVCGRYEAVRGSGVWGCRGCRTVLKTREDG